MYNWYAPRWRGVCVGRGLIDRATAGY